MSKSSREQNADRLYEWLCSDINDRGGTGRRIWRAQDGTGLDDQEMADAIDDLQYTGRMTVDEVTGKDFGFIYLVPVIPL